MERKEIMILLAVCAAVCLIIAGISKRQEEIDTSSVPAASVPAATRATTETNYWDKLHQQMETTTAPDVTGLPESDAGTGESQPADETVPSQPVSTEAGTSGPYSAVIISGGDQTESTTVTTSTTAFRIVVT